MRLYRPFRILFILVLGGLIALGFWLQRPFSDSISPEARFILHQAGSRERGREVFTAAGCESCHRGPERDANLSSSPPSLGGGLSFQTSFGTFVAPNISPHPQDGIGRWTIDLFAQALWQGLNPQGQHYFPLFPYAAYTHMTAEDLRDLWAYMQTLPAVEGRPPVHDLTFPFGWRSLLIFWKFLYFRPGPLPPSVSQSARWERGRYIVEALAHCAECHSPRNVLGGIPSQQRFTGGPALENKGWVPNITPHAQGLEKWSRADLIELLTTGITPDFDSVGGTMVEVVRHTSALPLEDREAIADYILSLAPQESFYLREKKENKALEKESN